MNKNKNKNDYFKKSKSKLLGAVATSLMGVLVSTSALADFVHTEGTTILDEQGEPLFLNGINLGNWLLWEGYLMMGDFNYRTHTQFLESLTTVFGSRAKAEEFEHQWRLNYVDDKAIADLKALGFNSVRVPFHYNMFWKNGQLSNHGFQYFDRLIESARAHGMYVLLDMHAAPGYQNPGDHADNVDSNASQPRTTVRFWDGTENIKIASDVWRHIANRYKDEPVVWGYDLFNEPVPQEGREFELLPSLITIRDAIREVDNNHIIVAEGSWWSSDLTKIDWSDPLVQQATGITSQWDSNLVYQLHHYGPAAGNYGRENITKNLNIPLILGEYGESDYGNLALMTDWAKQQTSGYFPWSFKKMSHDKTLWSIPPNEQYNQLKTYIINGSAGPASLYDAMIDFAQNNIKNGAPEHEWDQAFFDAINPSNEPPPPVVVPTCDSEDSAVTLPGVVQAQSHCASEGIQEETTADETGDINIGWIDSGDWAEYKINVPTAVNLTLLSRVASTEGSAGFNVLIDNTNVASVEVPATNGWQEWTSVATPVSLPAGEHILRLDFVGGNFNLNWLEFTTEFVALDPCETGATVLPAKIQAEEFCAMKGLRTQPTSDIGGGENVGWTDVGDWLEYSVKANANTEFNFNLRVASNLGGAKIDVLIDDQTVDTVSIDATGGWQQWVTLTVPVQVSAGVHRVRLAIKARGVNINWFEFETITPPVDPVDPVDPPSSVVEQGTYSIVNFASGKALDVSGVSYSDGANVHQWAYGGGANQKWVITNVGNNKYEIVSLHSGKCLDADSGSTNVHQWSCFGNDNQRWFIELLSSGQYAIKSANGQEALEVENGSTDNGSNIRTGAYTGNNNQKWVLERL